MGGDDQREKKSGDTSALRRENRVQEFEDVQGNNCGVFPYTVCVGHTWKLDLNEWMLLCSLCSDRRKH
jgi:hypothetical protein